MAVVPIGTPVGRLMAKFTLVGLSPHMAGIMVLHKVDVLGARISGRLKVAAPSISVQTDRAIEYSRLGECYLKLSVLLIHCNMIAAHRARQCHVLGEA